MLGAYEIYKHMAKVSERYGALKELFESFGDTAKSMLGAENCPVRGIHFDLEYQSDRFFVRFAGRCVCFAFFADVGSKGSYHAQVKCSLADPVTKTLGTTVETFSFNGQGETEIKLPPDGDVISVSSKKGPAYIVLHMLNEALDK